MRWDGQKLGTDDATALPGLTLAGLQRSVRTPEFAGVTFHEVTCKSALNKVPEASQHAVPLDGEPDEGLPPRVHATASPGRRTSTSTWTPGGTSRRRSSSRRTSSRCCAPSWRGRRGRASTWRSAPTPTRTSGSRAGTGSCRGSSRRSRAAARRCRSSPRARCCAGTCRCCAEVARTVPVGIGVSLAIGDEALQQAVEPGTPTPRARLDLIRAVREAGLPCGVMVAPVLPWLTDDRAHLDALLRDLADAGRDRASRSCRCTCADRSSRCSSPGCASTRPRSCAATRSCTAGAPTRRASTRAWLDERVRPLLVRHGFADRAGTGGTARDARGGLVPDGQHRRGRAARCSSRRSRRPSPSCSDGRARRVGLAAPVAPRGARRGARRSARGTAHRRVRRAHRRVRRPRRARGSSSGGGCARRSARSPT